MKCSQLSSQMFKCSLIIVLFHALPGNPLNAQVITISGQLTHSLTGEPLPGVTVIIPGTTIGTSANKNGEYSIEVPEGTNQLRFSFLGMKTILAEINERVNINLSMEEDILGLDEVVVAALGTSREKKSLGYAVQDLAGEDIAKAQERNILNALQGRLAGVQITNGSGSVSSGSRILIRGNSTLQGNNQPLFVIDGIAMMNAYSDLDFFGGIDYGNTVMDINPSDIQSISILKGANAAALYGSMAVNGVVMITTKGGEMKAGQARGIRVSLESNFMWDRPLIIPAFQDLYGQGFNGQFIYVDGQYGGLWDGSDESWGPKLDYLVQAEDVQPDGELYWTVAFGLPQTIGQTLVLPQFDSPYDPVTDIRTPTPWISHPNNVKDVFETGLSANNTLSISGASENANFRLSIGNQHVKGIVPNTDLRRNNVTLAGGLNVSKRFRINGTATYINNGSENIMSGGYQTTNILNSLSQWFGRQVDVVALKEAWNTTDPKTGKPFNWNHSYHDNPYFVLNRNLNSRNRNRFIGNVNANYQIAPFLSLTGRLGNDWFVEERNEIRAQGSVEWPDGAFDSYLSTRNQLTGRAQVNFNKIIGGFSFLASVGGEYSRFNYHSDDTHVEKLIGPGLYGVVNAAVPATTNMREEHSELQSVYGMVNLGYKNSLFLDFTARNDWSSTLPVKNNSYFYPSISMGFILTEALKLQSGILSFLKLRASYAEVGGSTAAYRIKGTFSGYDEYIGDNALTYTDTRPEPDLKPQNKKSIEFGTEIKLFNNRMGADLTWYKENTINQIMNINVSGTSGFDQQLINAGNLQNEGWELTFWASPVRTNNFQWDLSLNWARNINTVVELYEDRTYHHLYNAAWGVQVLARVGEPYGQMWGKDIVREHAITHYLDEAETLLDYIEYSGRPLLDTRGRYIEADQATLLGNVMPDWFGGMNNSFAYKNLYCSFLVDLRWGGDQFSITNQFGRLTGILAETARQNANGKNVRDPVTEGGGVLVENGVYGYVNTDGSVQFTDEDGNDVDEPVGNTTYVNGYAFYHSPAGHSSSVFDASFVKLREVILGYNFLNVTKWISNLNLSIVGRNLWLIYSGIPDVDPENAYSPGNMSVGMNSNPIPTTRSLGFNVKITF